MCTYCVFFFFQAEDGIRDIGVTGVQTCALPIYPYVIKQSFRSLYRVVKTARLGRYWQSVWKRLRHGSRKLSDSQIRWIVKSRDRKSTRLNSSHANISYAVFCLKKKKKKK